ncbi:MAG: hypothetical protein WD068_01925 [Candidatus Babeliales bacterium]
MKHLSLKNPLYSALLAIFIAYPITAQEPEIPLLNQSGHADEPNQDQSKPLLLDEPTQQLIAILSILLTGYVLQHDIKHIWAHPLKRQLFIKGAITYATGKQLMHQARDASLAKELGSLFCHYGKTVIALSLIYG